MHLPTLLPPLDDLLPRLTRIAHEAGEIALRDFRLGERTVAQIWSKAGGSPVTAADLAVDAFLHEQLCALVPQAAWLSEETADDPERLDQSLVWIVDPIDGTRGFLTGSPEWTIAIALVRDGLPILGVVHAPVPHQTFSAIKGRGAHVNGVEIKVSSAEALAGVRAAGASLLIAEAEKQVGPLTKIARIPSLALRLARVAQGIIDIGFVSPHAKDWDLAAAHLLVEEAGGVITALDGAPVHYNTPSATHGPLIAGSPILHAQALNALKSVSALTSPA